MLLFACILCICMYIYVNVYTLCALNYVVRKLTRLQFSIVTVMYCLITYVAVSDTVRYAAIADITVSDSVLLY